MSDREVLEGLQEQGTTEAIVRRLTLTPTPTAVSSVLVLDITNNAADVTATVMPGSPTLSDGVIVLPAMSGLTAQHIYRVHVLYSVQTSVFDAYFRVWAKR